MLLDFLAWGKLQHKIESKEVLEPCLCGNAQRDGRHGYDLVWCRRPLLSGRGGAGGRGGKDRVWYLAYQRLVRATVVARQSDRSIPLQKLRAAIITNACAYSE